MQSGRKLQPDSSRELRRYEALLHMADLMVHHRSLPEPFHELAQRIQKVVDFQLLNFSLHNPRHNRMDMHLWEGELVSDFPTQLIRLESSTLVIRNRTALGGVGVLILVVRSARGRRFASAGHPPPEAKQGGPPVQAAFAFF